MVQNIQRDDARLYLTQITEVGIMLQVVQVRKVLVRKRKKKTDFILHLHNLSRVICHD